MSQDEPPRREWMKVVDPRLLDKCHQHERDGKQLEFRPRMQTYFSMPRLHVMPEEWGAGYLCEPREWERPAQVVSDLKLRSPQALLRDLYRPVRADHWHRFETIEGTVRSPLAGVDEARQARRVPMIAPRVEPIVRTVLAFMYWRIGMMQEPWQPMLPDDAPRRDNVIA
jgi:hypothetical protein